MAQELKNKFAVGIIATGLNSLGVLRTVDQARQDDRPVLVTYYESDVFVAAARELGADVVHPTKQHLTWEDLRENLVSAARENGHPGIVIHETSDRMLDFDEIQDVAKSSTEYAVEPAGRRPGRVPDAPDVLVAVPAYDEADTIADVVAGAYRHADAVLVVDDGSTDRTVRRAEEAGAYVVEHEHNRGYGGALKTAFREASRWNADHLVVLDGDGQHDTDDIPRLVSVQRERSANVVIGSRFGDGNGRGMAAYRRVGVEVVNALTNVGLTLMGTRVTVRDTQSGFRAYDSRAIETLANAEGIGDGMSASLDVIFNAVRNGCTIDEVGTTIDYEVNDTSTLKPFEHGYGLVKAVLHTVTSERPLLSLGFPGFLFTLLGAGFGFWTFSSYINTGSFPVGLGLSTALFVFVGLMVGITSVILYAMKLYHSNGLDHA